MNNLFISENNLNDQLHKDRLCETIKKFDLTDVLNDHALFDGKKTLFSKKKKNTYISNNTNIDPDIYIKVSLNEYIELAKYYSTTKSSTFINGVLDRITKDFKEAGKIVKTGRGLLES